MDDLKIREHNLKKLFGTSTVYLYGAGEWTRRFLNYIGDDMKPYIEEILVLDIDGNPDNISGIPVRSIDSIVPGDEVLILVTIYENKQIIENLHAIGFKNIISLKEIMPSKDFDDYRIRRNHEIKRYIEYFKRENPLFRYIEIETINRCNGECSFCPVNKYEEQRPYCKMSKEMFATIIDELDDLEYDGSVALFSNNEPFIDERIFEFAEYARNKLGKALIYLFSNGKLLTLEKFKQIVPFIDKLQIDNYENKLIPQNIQEVIDYCKDKDLMEKIELYFVDKDEVRFSRAGLAPNSKIYYTEETLCALPFIELVIRPDGKVSLCCNDALGKSTLGDLTKNSLREIWYGNEFKKVREAVQKGRYGVPLCRYCNTLDFREIFSNRMFGVEQAIDLINCIVPNSFLDNKKIYIWGCDDNAKELYHNLLKKKCLINGFVESDKFVNHGKVVDGIYCYSPEDIFKDVEEQKPGVYIASKNRYGTIYHLLREYGITDIRLYLKKDPL